MIKEICEIQGCSNEAQYICDFCGKKVCGIHMRSVPRGCCGREVLPHEWADGGSEN